MKENRLGLGPREAAFLMEVSAKKGGRFDALDASRYWSSSHVAHNKLSELSRKGWIARIERGKYIVIPFEAGPQRSWTQDEYITAQMLVQPAAIAYWTALHHWNWTEQIPRNFYVQTTSRKYTKLKFVFGVRYDFVTVPMSKFYGNACEWREGTRVFVTDREKTLVDCADDIGRAGGPLEFSKAVRQSVNEVDWNKLNKYVLRHPNGAVRKRLGFLFESISSSLPVVATRIIDTWRKSLTSGISLLVPYAGTKGIITTRWKILDNIGIRNQ